MNSFDEWYREYTIQPISDYSILFPSLEEAYEAGRKEGKKEGMERAADRMMERVHNDPLLHDHTPLSALIQEAKAIRKEIENENTGN